MTNNMMISILKGIQKNYPLTNAEWQAKENAESEGEAERQPNNRWCNTCEYKHLESECLGCAEYDECDNLINLRNYKKEESKEE